MNKKIIYGLIVIILLAAGAWLITKSKGGNTLGIFPEKKPEVIIGDAASGWSKKDDVKEAVGEAVSMMKQGLGGKSPKYVFFYAGIGKNNIGYDSEKLVAELRNQLGADVKIHGESSSLGVLTKEGFHIGEVGSLALMGVASEKMEFGVGGISLDGISAKEAGKKAIQAAIKNASKEGLPQNVRMTAAPGAEEDILPGIEEVLGKNIPVVGGSAGDNDLTGKWYVVANDKIYKNGVVLTAVYTNLKIGYAHEQSYSIGENKGIVTRAKGRVLYEINGRPAATVYNEWTGGLVENIIQKGGIIGGSVLGAVSAYYPLGRAIQGAETSYIAVMPYGVNEDKSLALFANVEEGDEVLLLHGTWELLLNRAYSTPKKALASKAILSGDGLFGIYTFCTGAIFSVPAEERAKLIVFINNALGGIPFVGGFTLGEQVFLPGAGDRHTNLVNSMVVFGKK